MASTYLSWTPSNTGTRTTFTWSFWVKRHGLGSYQKIHDADYNNDANYYCSLYFKNDDTINMSNIDAGSTNISWSTTRKFRDTNAWYHIVVTFDTTNATANDRIRCYVNGERETLTGTFAVAQNTDNTFWNRSGNKNWIGAKSVSVSDYLDATLSHFHFIDGTAYDASAFGSTDSTTGEWKINTSPSVTYGTNGFFILKDGNSVTDQSGNSNNWTVASGTLTNTEDCPDNVFATINPLTQEHTNNSIGYSSGNTNIFFDQTGQWWHTTSTLGAITGKYYAECKIDAVGGEASLGIISSDTACANQGTGDYIGKEVDSIGYLNNGRTMKANSQQQTGLTALSSGTIVGIAMDLDNNTVQFYINGSTSGNTVSLTANKFYLFGCSGYSDTRFYWNFGNGYFNTTAISSEGTNASGIGKFEYDVPTGYTALSTKGLNE